MMISLVGPCVGADSWRLGLRFRPASRCVASPRDSHPARQAPHARCQWAWALAGVVERTLVWAPLFSPTQHAIYERRACLPEAFLMLGCSLICWNLLETLIDF